MAIFILTDWTSYLFPMSSFNVIKPQPNCLSSRLHPKRHRTASNKGEPFCFPERLHKLKISRILCWCYGVFSLAHSDNNHGPQGRDAHRKYLQRLRILPNCFYRLLGNRKTTTQKTDLYRMSIKPRNKPISHYFFLSCQRIWCPFRNHNWMPFC